MKISVSIPDHLMMAMQGLHPHMGVSAGTWIISVVSVDFRPIRHYYHKHCGFLAWKKNGEIMP